MLPTFARDERTPRALVALAATLAFLYLYDADSNPAGFFVDEASIAYNAHTVARFGADEYGEPWPLFFRAFGEYKSPAYIYLLAAVFKLTGPSIAVARGLSSVLGLVACALVGLLAARATRRRAAGLSVFVAAALTPWLFEVSRLVFEVSMLPASLALFLLLLHRASAERAWTWRVSAALGALLGLMVYVYAGARVLAPLLAFGLVLFATRGRRRAVLLTWAFFALTLVPLAVYSQRHPGALGERFKYTTFVKPGDTTAEIVSRFALNYAGSFSPRSWLVEGDPEPRHHLPGAGGSLLAGAVVLSIVGLVVVFARHRDDAWWRYVVYGLAVAPVPGALTLDHFHTLRLVALPVFLLVLAAPAVAFLLEGGRARRAALALLLAATLAQGAFFRWRFETAPPRVYQFDTFYPELLDAALARPERPVYLLDKTPSAYVYAYWYATLRGAGVENFHRIPRDEPPPAGALVISHDMPCAPCAPLLERGDFKLYVAENP